MDGPIVSERFPRAEIGSFPTSVERISGFGAAIGVENLHIKRDDRAGKPYGGNKVRKLDFLLGEALETGRRRVLTTGGVGSHHVLATCVYAREVGLEPAAVQYPQPVTEHVRENLRVLASIDPDLRLARSPYLMPYHYVRSWLLTRFDGSVYYVPVGGTSPLGTLGFVAAAGELERQVDAGEAPEPDAVVVPASSGGTFAGLRVGLDHTSLDTHVVGVRVAPRYATNRWRIARLANETTALLDEPSPHYDRKDIDLLSGYLGSGYAEPSPDGERIRERAAEFDLELDPTYTAKTVAAIEDQFDDETVLYWHTHSSISPEPAESPRDRLPAEYWRFLDDEN